MNEYIRMRVRADAAHTVALASNEARIAHPGVRGRFRELLVNNLLLPWLPPYVGCGTGVIVDAENRARNSTQEDIILFDRSLMPSVLVSTHAPEGIFPLNGVLGRVEVKSKLTKAELRSAVSAAAEIFCMKFAGVSGPIWPLPANLIFAYDTDLQPGGDPIQELKRLVEVSLELGLYFNGVCPDNPGPISGLCVVERGCWVFGAVRDDEAKWIQAKRSTEYEEILLFVGALSNSCFNFHVRRQGRDPKMALEGGIGNFIISTEVYEPVLLNLATDLSGK